MRGLLSAILVLLSATPLSAKSGELEALAHAVDAFECYDVSFRLAVNGDAFAQEGRYRVDGDRYSLDMAGYKIFGEDGVRYTIDDALREVVIESVADDGALPMIVQDPTSAFTSLGEYFTENVTSRTESTTTLQLTPKSRRASEIVLSVELTLDSESHLPRSISYEADEEVVEVEILSIESASQGVEIDYPEEYDIIDIR